MHRHHPWLPLILIVACGEPDPKEDTQDPAPGDSCEIATWYADADGDGHGDPVEELEACEPPDGWVAEGDDCDDDDPEIAPGAHEHCDGRDEDCDGEVDEPGVVDGETFWPDADTDGYGAQDGAIQACEQPSGYVEDAQDCDDGNPEVNPAARELCNGVDDDCDGEVDEASADDVATWWADEDGDGYGDPRVTTEACEQPSGHVEPGTVDCDDADASVSPELDADGHGCIEGQLEFWANSSAVGDQDASATLYVHYDEAVTGWAAVELPELINSPTYTLALEGTLSSDGGIEPTTFTSFMYEGEGSGFTVTTAEGELLSLSFEHQHHPGGSGEYYGWQTSGTLVVGGTRTTPCGTDSCDRDTEVCVACNCGGPTSFQCVALPTGCEDDRSCGCVGDDICAFASVPASCEDQPEDNTVLCESGLD